MRCLVESRCPLLSRANAFVSRRLGVVAPARMHAGGLAGGQADSQTGRLISLGVSACLPVDGSVVHAECGCYLLYISYISHMPFHIPFHMCLCVFSSHPSSVSLYITGNM